MHKLTTEQIFKIYPFLRELSTDTLFVSQDEDNENKYSKTVKINSNGKNVEITILLLRKLLKEDKYYEYIKKLFDGQIIEFKISGVTKSGYRSKEIVLNKIEIVEGLKKIIADGKVKFNRIEEYRFEELNRKVMFEEFIRENSKLGYLIDIDGSEIVIPIINILNFIQLPDDYYKTCINESYLSNVKKEYFIYSVIRFFDDEKIFENYELPNIIINRLNELKTYENVDVEAFNKIIETKDVTNEDVIIDSSLEREILEGIDTDFTPLEKAIYIYVKMCKLFVYDEEFFAAGQVGKVRNKHSNVGHIKEITKENNKIVCYEFNEIYAKLLKKLGINYVMNTGKNFSYGVGHINLTYRVDKFLIKADAINKILKGDLFNAKLNQPLQGLKSINTSTKTKQEFNEILSRVYKKIMCKDTELSHIESFNNTLNLYQKRSNIIPVSFEEKISIIIEKSKTLNFSNVDQLSYILFLYTIIFDYKERKEKTMISIIQNKEEDKVKPTIIFTINKINIDKKSKDNVHIYYDFIGNPIRISNDELQTKFDNGILSYIPNYTNYNHIPGIVGDEYNDRRIN